MKGMLRAFFLGALTLILSAIFNLSAADSLSPERAEPRARWNAVGDRAVAGDKAAQQELEAVYLFYFQNEANSRLSPLILSRDKNEIAPALMNYRYLLIVNKAGSHRMAPTSIEPAKRQILEAAQTLNFPPALSLSDDPDKVLVAANAGMTDANIKMAMFYRGLLGENAPMTDNMIASLADYYLRNASALKPSELQIGEITAEKSRLTATGIALHAGSLSLDGSEIIENEMTYILATSRQRAKASAGSIGGGCGLEPDLETDPSSYSRAQMEQYLDRIDRYAAWRRCLIDARNTYVTTYNVPASAPQFMSLPENTRNNLFQFMKEREMLRASYLATAEKEARTAAVDDVDRIISTTRNRFEAARSAAQRRVDQLRRAASSSDSPRRSTRPESRSETEADRFFRNRQLYENCIAEANARPAGPARNAAVRYCLDTY
jgi:hypothetical protein